MLAPVCIGGSHGRLLALRTSARPGVLQQPRIFYGHTSSLLRSGCQRVTRASAAGRLVVQANELNKWADRSNYDEHDESSWEWSQFDRDTANTLMRVLTAKATQRLLTQLQELDLFKAQWLNNYCSTNPPSEGNKFLLKLFRQPASVVKETSTGIEHTIDPSNLAHRIIQIRSDMAQVMLQFPKYMALENTEVLRQHISTSTYMSGTSEVGYKERRGYYRRRSSSK